MIILIIKLFPVDSPFMYFSFLIQVFYILFQEPNTKLSYPPKN